MSQNSLSSVHIRERYVIRISKKMCGEEMLLALAYSTELVCNQADNFNELKAITLGSTFENFVITMLFPRTVLCEL